MRRRQPPQLEWAFDAAKGLGVSPRPYTQLKRKRSERQAGTRAFIESPKLELFCDWLDWDAEAIRGAAA